MAEFDFCGWATKNDIKCTDGRTIRKDAFIGNDGQTVPLVWNHDHNNPSNVLGHALLQNRNEGVYAYCSFNDTDDAQAAKRAVKHGDIKSLSIYANKLKQNGGDVIHGIIREVSLVLAGANSGAVIDNVMAHSEEDGESAVICFFEDISEEATQDEIEHAEKEEKEPKKMAEGKEKTVQDVFNELTEEQKKVVYAMIGMALEEKEGEKEEMAKHNVFDTDTAEDTLQHDAMEADLAEIIRDGKRYGSLKESFLQHSASTGITNIDWLYPDARLDKAEPDFVRNDAEWVGKVMNGVKHTPFSRIKSRLGNLTADEARALGYVKGNEKAEQVITLLKRSTSPTTVYVKQKMDRDDIVDITDFNVVAWLKKEMRWMLDEEIARAILIGDQRQAVSDDKIDENCIRPIWTDASTYVINRTIELEAGYTPEDEVSEFIDKCVSRKGYKGSGNVTLFTSEDYVDIALLLKDLNGHRLYKNVGELATAMRVKEIVTVPQFDNLTREVSGTEKKLLGILVNMADYTVGADKGGSVNMFDDFDIDYNQEKYLMETRCSGSLLKPYSAIVIESVEPEEE